QQSPTTTQRRSRLCAARTADSTAPLVRTPAMTTVRAPTPPRTRSSSVAQKASMRFLSTTTSPSAGRMAPSNSVSGCPSTKRPAATTALDGLRVLDFSTGLAGATTTMVLADNGAEVIKVEPPGGDPDRALPAFAQWHRGKQSLVLDLHTPEGQPRARALAAETDPAVQA